MREAYLGIETLQEALEISFFFDEAILLEDAESSSDFAKNAIERNQNFRTAIIVVNRQSKGRGRQNKTWISEYGSCLTFSFVISSKDFSLSDYSSLVCAKALHSALLDYEEIRKANNLTIKWPNDIYAGEKKIAGILVENIYREERLDRQIVGIGLNFASENFDSEDLKDAGSIQSVYGFTPELNELFLRIIRALERTLQEKDFDYGYLNNYSYLYGKPILWRNGKKELKAKALEMTEKGELRILTEDGEYKKVFSGTIALNSF